MNKFILAKLHSLSERFEELSALLSDAQVINNQELFRNYSKEYAELESIINVYRQYQATQTDLKEAQQMLDDSDTDMVDLAKEEIHRCNELTPQLHSELQIALLPKDTRDHCHVFLEIRAGTGGDEAAIFAGDLFRMYSKYSEKQNWSVEIISTSAGDHGGYKEIISRIVGSDVYAYLKFESGAHRVQRVPETESQGRIHTSACTVAIIPEPDAKTVIDLRREDLRIDTFRSSGAGGQHVNTTDSAIRITHLPTGTVVECQDERSQHKNKAKAMAWLTAKLENQKDEADAKALRDTRRSLVGSGDRSERIRTYNYPQGRVTDHRINLTLHRLPDIIEGELSQIIDSLRQQHQANQLTDLASEETI